MAGTTLSNNTAMIFKKKRTTGDAHEDVPARFLVAGKTLFLDRFMTGVITGGGIAVIVSVIGIFLFILAETLPLFYGASVNEISTVSERKPEVLTRIPKLDDEWIFLGHDETGLVFFNTKTSLSGRYVPVIPDGGTISNAAAVYGGSEIAVSTTGKKVYILGAAETLEADLGSDSVNHPVNHLEAAHRGHDIVASVSFSSGGAPIVQIVSFGKNSFTDEKTVDVATLDLPAGFALEYFSLNDQGTGIVALSGDGGFHYYGYDEDDGEWLLKQSSRFAMQGQGESVSSVCWLAGGNSVVLGGNQGSLSVYSIFSQTNEAGRQELVFGKVRDLTPLKGNVFSLVPSAINHSFLAVSEDEMGLYYSTTGDLRWEGGLDGFKPQYVVADSSLDNLLLVSDSQGIRHYEVSDPHPESGMTAFFAKIHYEGYPDGRWVWQSVGGTDAYEPKLSLMPLLFGTLKGTVYALLFAVPIALMAAVYTAQFMGAKAKSIVKPAMEIMASLPSVVLGFFGALYLAPLMESKVPAIICMLVLIPLAAVGMGFVWMKQKQSLRNRFAGGVEYIALMPVIIIVAWFCWQYLGDWCEPAIVKTISMVCGMGDADNIRTFSELWRNGFGLPYEQRNSLVVGFVMGFAVIPVIFTIAEDSLSNVPPSLVHASQALGASRWQVVRTVVLPVAAAGIFSALMIGFGRAIGETMIVLMATGNTPVMDWNIFNGMRTLSANIATELPEAAIHSTHYRVLFLCGFILFVMTFVLNTVAEVLRNHLRERFKII